MKTALALATVAMMTTACAGTTPRVMDVEYACNYPFSCVNADAQIRELERQLQESRNTSKLLASIVVGTFDKFRFESDSKESRNSDAMSNRQFQACVKVNIQALKSQCPGQNY